LTEVDVRPRPRRRPLLRAHPDKQTPLIIDVVDPYSLFFGESRKRERWYAEMQYVVTTEELE